MQPRSCDTLAVHEHAALAFHTSGRTRFEQAGTWELGAGDVLLVPAGAPHRLLEAQRSEYWGLGFRAPLYAAQGDAALLEPFERVRDGASAVVAIPSERHAFLDMLFGELARQSAGTADVVDAAAQRSLLTLILSEVARAFRALPLAHGREHASVVADSLRFIERNCLRKLTLGEVAAAVGRSPAYVTTALSRATGRSALQWVVSGRMAEARRLLLASDERIEHVAERVGYADVTHFVRMFRRELGVTPAAWRAAQRR